MNYYSQVPIDYKPISAWGYIGYQILYSIPIIGFIFLVINAIGATNINVRNFARSYFCILIIVLLIAFFFGTIPFISFNL